MRREINIPFQGFYYSWLSDAVDRELEVHAERLHEDYPHISREEIQDAFFGHTAFSYVHRTLAGRYTEELSQLVEDETGLSLQLEFVTMESPREYNFQTDRIFATAPLESIAQMMQDTQASTLASMIKERHTSRDGFISFYSNQMDTWLVKPLEQWDPNEVGTLLRAYLGQHLEENWEYNLTLRLIDSEYVGEAFEAAVDWSKIHELIGDSENEQLLH